MIAMKMQVHISGRRQRKKLCTMSHKSSSIRRIRTQRRTRRSFSVPSCFPALVLAPPSPLAPPRSPLRPDPPDAHNVRGLVAHRTELLPLPPAAYVDLHLHRDHHLHLRELRLA